MLYWVSGAFGEGGIDATKSLVLKLVLAPSPCLLFGVSLSTNFGIPHGTRLRRLSFGHLHGRSLDFD